MSMSYLPYYTLIVCVILEQHTTTRSNLSPRSVFDPNNFSCRYSQHSEYQYSFSPKSHKLATTKLLHIYSLKTSSLHNIPFQIFKCSTAIYTTGTIKILKKYHNWCNVKISKWRITNALF